MFRDWAAKRVCKFFLKRFLGKFIRGELDLDGLEVQLGAGTVQLNGLALNTDYLNEQTQTARSIECNGIHVLCNSVPRFEQCGICSTVVDVERTVFYREKAAGMYSALRYGLAHVLIEVPYIFVQTVVYGVIVYALIDFRWTAAKFFWYFFMMFFTLLYTKYYGMMTVALTPNASVALLLSTGFVVVWMVFSGFIIPRPRIPVWWRWYYWASPFAWTLYGLVASQFGDVSDEMVMADGGKQEVNKFLRLYFGYRQDFMGPVAVVTVSFPILFALIFAVSIKTLNFQTR